MRGMKKWFRDAFLPRYRRCQRELTSCVQWTREKVMRVVNSAVDPILLAGFFLFSWLAYDTYSGLGKLGEDESARVLEWLKFYAYLVGGIVLIWQVRISNRRAVALEKTAALGEKGNITERFKSAIEHLAHEMDSVQIGGIYTLYHVAKEAEEYRDAVLKILLAHLRKITAGKESVDGNEVVIAIMDALFAKTGESPLFDKVDLSRVNLMNFWGPTLGRDRNLGLISKANHLNLTDAYFASSNLTGAKLSGAILRRTDFTFANISGADFSHAVIGEGTTFARAICVGASFSDAMFFENTLFDWADLTNADFLNSKISAQQLLKAKTLYGVELDDHIREEIMRRKPELLLDPPTEYPPAEEEE